MNVPRLFNVLWIFLVLVVADEEYSAPSRTKRDTNAKPITRKLKIVTIQNLPYVNITQGSSGAQFVGFIPDLIFALSQKLNFEYEFYRSPDGRYGAEQPDGSWSGMIGELILNEHNTEGEKVDPDQPGADMIAAPLTMTSKRQKVVNFLHPFHNLGLTIVAKKVYLNDSLTDVWPFDFSILQPMSAAVWGMIVLIAAVVSVLLFAMNRYNPYEWGGRYDIGLASLSQKESFSLSGSLWFIFSTFQWQGFERAPRSIASKILTCFWFAFVTLTLVTYIGTLVNHLWWSSMVMRHDPSKHPVRDLEDLVSGQGRYMKYGTMNGGSTYNYVMDVMAEQNVEYSSIKHYWNTDEGKSCLVSSAEEGIEKVRSENYAFIMESMAARYELNRQPCDLTTIGPDFASRSYGLAVPKNWPYMDQFHAGIMDMKESGALDQLEKHWWVSRGECWEHKYHDDIMEKATAMYVTQAKPKIVDLNMFLAQIVLIIVGTVISVLAAVGEIIYYRYKGRYLQSNRPQEQTLKLENEDGGI